MSTATTDTPKPETKFDAEAFAMNVARAMESGGKALAAYLKPRESGEVQDRPPAELTEVVKTFTSVAEYWLSDTSRASDLQTKLAKDYLDLWGSAARRMAGQDAPPAIAPSPRDKRFADPEWKSNQFFDFVMQLYLLTTKWAQELVRDADGLDPQTRRKAEFYIQQVTNAISPSNFVLTNPEVLRETVASSGENLARGLKMLAEDIAAGKGMLKIRQSNPDNLVVGVNMATTPGKVIYQNEMMQLIQYSPTTENGAAHPAPDRAALDQQVLHPRSQAGEILHQVVRRPGHHRVRDLMGQSRQAARQQELGRLHEGRPAHGDGRDREGHRRDEGAHRRLLRRRHRCSRPRWPGSPRSAASAWRRRRSSPRRSTSPMPAISSCSSTRTRSQPSSRT